MVREASSWESDSCSCGRKCFLLSSLFNWRRRSADTFPQDLWSTFCWPISCCWNFECHKNVLAERCKVSTRKTVFRAKEVLRESAGRHPKKNRKKHLNCTQSKAIETRGVNERNMLCGRTNQLRWDCVSHTQASREKGVFFCGGELNHLNSLHSMFELVCDSGGVRTGEGAIAATVLRPKSKPNGNGYICIQMWWIIRRWDEASAAISQITHSITHCVRKQWICGGQMRSDSKRQLHS